MGYLAIVLDAQDCAAADVLDRRERRPLRSTLRSTRKGRSFGSSLLLFWGLPFIRTFPSEFVFAVAADPMLYSSVFPPRPSEYPRGSSMMKRHPSLVVCAVPDRRRGRICSEQLYFPAARPDGSDAQIVGLGDNDFHRSVSSPDGARGALQGSGHAGRHQVLHPRSGGRFRRAMQRFTAIPPSARLPGAATAAEITPDGKYLLVIAGDHFYILNAPDRSSGSTTSRSRPIPGFPSGATPIARGRQPRRQDRLDSVQHHRRAVPSRL